jgi:hypothetical protein
MTPMIGWVCRLMYPGWSAFPRATLAVAGGSHDRTGNLALRDPGGAQDMPQMEHFENTDNAACVGSRADDLLSSLEQFGFPDEAGLPLKREEMKARINLWVVLENGKPIMHTTAMGEWRFYVFTNRAEAERMANHWNESRFGWREFCKVGHLLDNMDLHAPLPGAESSCR